MIFLKLRSYAAAVKAIIRAAGDSDEDEYDAKDEDSITRKNRAKAAREKIYG